ncbi:Laminin subunit alpha-3 [Lemmus lemmus]
MCHGVCAHGLFYSLQRQMREMNSLKNDFAKYLATADSSLLQTNNLLQQMDKSQKEYESLAAALNGARQELSDKVQELSRSASKASVVVEAEKHAQSLQELAKQLEEIKRNTSGDELVRCAVDAATAYENILNAIRAAEDAANKATSASESALQTLIKEDLPRRAKTLSSDSDELLNEAKVTQKRLQQEATHRRSNEVIASWCFLSSFLHLEVSPALNSLQQTLTTVSVQKKLLDANLTAVCDSLHGLQRGDIESVIHGARSMVRKANGVTSEVLDGLNPIQTDLGRIKDSYRSTRHEDFSKALANANNSVKKLTKKLPDLFIKIESINQQLLPLGNISDNMDRIRELIHQARDAANKVSVSMLP